MPENHVAFLPPAFILVTFDYKVATTSLTLEPLLVLLLTSQKLSQTIVLFARYTFKYILLNGCRVNGCTKLAQTVIQVQDAVKYILLKRFG